MVFFVLFFEYTTFFCHKNRSDLTVARKQKTSNCLCLRMQSLPEHSTAYVSANELSAEQESAVAPYSTGAPVCYCIVLNTDDATQSDVTYVGFTVNMRKRLRQHRRCIKGGAKYTNRGTCNWTVAMVVSQFRTRREARQFEWAWKRCRAGTRKNVVVASLERRTCAMKALMLREQWKHLVCWSPQNSICVHP